MAKEIVIVSGDPSTKKLVLEPNDTVWVRKGQKVNWSIKDDAKVGCFRIARKSNSNEIFLFVDRPPAHQTTHGGGRVDWFAKNNEIYDYSIFWKINPDDPKEEEKEFDPKLAVMPSLSPDTILLVGALAMTALGIFAMQYWFRRQRRKNSVFGAW